MEIPKIEVVASQKGYRVISGIPHSKRGPLKAAPDSKGYLRFKVTIYTGRSITCWVHRLVAFQKFGMALYSGAPDVRHRDGNQKNNSEENILLGTRRDNRLDVPKEQRSASAKRMNITKHAALWREIDTLLDAGNGIRPTARILGVATSTVYNRTLKRKEWH